MRNINIKDLKISIELSSLLKAIDASEPFEIDIDGNIHFNKSMPDNTIRIFEAKCTKSLNLFDMNTKIKNLFGKDYKPQIVGSTCVITPLPSWMPIVDLNKENMLYFDHQTDGVEYFEDSSIEDIGWNATPFDIKYRQLTDFIENNCDGIFLYYDNGMHFNGFVVVNDINEVEEKLTTFVKDLIINKIENIDELDDDQLESLEFFDIK